MDPVSRDIFRFRQFAVSNRQSAMKITTDSILLGAWAEVAGARRILDAGTGTGVLALMMAQRAENALITAIEIDPVAANEAKANFEASPWAERIQSVAGDFLEMECGGGGGFDLIISNPPFFGTGEKAPDARRAMARHGSGFNLQSLISHSAGLLRPGGRLAFVAPSLRDEEVEFHAVLHGLSVRRHTSVVTRQKSNLPERSLWMLVKGTDGGYSHDVLYIRNPHDGGYSEAYRELVKDFYLWMN